MPDQNFLLDAKQALRKNQRQEAWQILHSCVEKNPDQLEAWLLLGGLAPPKESLLYLKRAEMLAPTDERVRRAIVWAKERIEPIPEKLHAGLDSLDDHPGDDTDQNIAVFTDESLTQPNQLLLDQVESETSDQEHPDTIKKVSRWIWIRNIGYGLMISILLALLAIGIIFRVQGKDPQIFGHKLIIVTSGSMEPTFDTGSLIFINTQMDQDYEVGDVVMFSTDEIPQNVTHRIIEITEVDGVRAYLTKGDNNDFPDLASITDENILGKYTYLTIPFLGQFFQFLRSREGILLLMSLFGLYLVVTQGYRIKQLLSDSKT